MIPAPPPGQNDKVISVREVSFTYEGGLRALSGVSLDVKSGDYLAVVGGNGCGKTTLAKVIVGLLRPDSGSILISGRRTEDLTVAEIARTVGYAFQNPDHQLFCPTVLEEVRFGPRNMGYDGQEVEAKVAHALEAMDIVALRDSAPFSLTLSERRRVSIAAVIATDPKVLILDEPTTGLDARETQDLMDSIGRLNREGKTIVLITHDMKLVAGHAKRVVVMSEGRIVLDADASGVFSDLDSLLRSRLIPPPVAQLAYRLAPLGVPRDVLSPQELVLRLMMARGGR